MLANQAAVIGCASVVARSSLRFGCAVKLSPVSRAGAAVMRLAVAGRALHAIGRQAVARLVFAALAKTIVIGASRHAGGLVIVKALRAVRGAEIGALRGPGASVGEVVHALPGELADMPLPVGFIGRKLAALALIRGEAPMIDGTALLIGGRVLIDANGANVYVTDESAAKLVWSLSLEAAALAGGEAMAAGVVRDTWLSRGRVEAAAYVKKNAKAAGIVGGAKGRALLADLRFMELRA